MGEVVTWDMTRNILESAFRTTGPMRGETTDETSSPHKSVINLRSYDVRFIVLQNNHLRK